MTVKDIYNFIDSFAPYETQCQWDNSGLMLGSMDDSVTGVMLSLDCTNEVISQAIVNDCNMILTHHPLIFNPLKNVEKNSPVWNAVENNISVLSVHTNLDMADGGVNDVLGKLLELKKISKLYAENAPIMRTGDASFSNGKELAKFVSKKLGGGVILSDSGKKIQKIAVCSGAGGEYLREAYSAGCDAFITGEAKHHEFTEADSLGITMIAAGHYQTENPIVNELAKKLAVAFPTLIIGTSEKSPYETVI